MKIGWAITFLAAAGCSGVTRKEFSESVDANEKFHAEMSSNNDLQSRLYKELVDSIKPLNERTARLEMLVAALQKDAERMEDRLKSAAAPAAGPAARPPGPMPARKIEEILLDTESALAGLRAGRLTPEDAANQLKEYARVAAPRLADELRRSIAKIDYTTQIESILSRFPGDELKVPLQGALSEPGIRISAARVVGGAGDRELSKILEEHAASDDEDFRLAAAESLVRCRNSAGVPALVAALKSAQRDSRIIAINTLRPLNAGKDFGYRAQKPPEENAEALQSWEEWAEKFGKAIFE